MNIKGVGIGRGVAVGPVIRMAAPLPEPSDAPRAENISAETEIARVEKSLALVNADLNRRAEEAANGDEGAKQAAPILQAIAMFASDPSLAQSIKDLINQGKTAERAVLEGFGAVEDMFRAIGGYQAERAADLHDVGQRWRPACHAVPWLRRHGTWRLRRRRSRLRSGSPRSHPWLR